MASFEILITILLICVVGVLVVNLIATHRVRAKFPKFSNEISDARFFELKYRIELLQTVSIIAVGIAGLLGYGGYREIKTTLTQKIEDSLRAPLRELDTIYKKTSQAAEFIDSFKIQQATLDSNIGKSANRISTINNIVAKIAANDILKQNIHIVKDIPFPIFDPKTGEQNGSEKRFYFKNLRNTVGERLPNYTKPPIVIATTNATANVQVYRINTEGFSIGIIPTDSIGLGPKYQDGKVSLLIYKIPD